MQLYIKRKCPYCIKVLKVIEEHNIDVEIIEAENGSKNQETLINIGGKQQVPFLLDKETKMYESDDIIAYLVRHTA